MSKIKIIKRLKKLMLHERSARVIGNEAEADRFAETIADLRAKHGITQEIVLDETGDENYSAYGGESLFDETDPMFRRQRVYWEEVMFGNVCAFFGCWAVLFRKTNLKVVIGEPEQREKVKTAYLHLYRTATGTATCFLENFPDGTASENRLRRQSFLYGFTEAVRQRLSYCARARMELDELCASNDVIPQRVRLLEQQSGALVKTEKIAVREQREMLDKKIEKLKPPPPPKIGCFDDEAFFAGMREGAGCSLTDQIELPATEMFKDLEDVRRQIEERKRRLFWEDHFVKSGNFYYGGSKTSSTRTYQGRQMTFVFDEDDSV